MENFLSKQCPCCGHTSKQYKIQFSNVLLSIVKKVFAHCVFHHTYLFQKNDLDLTHTDYGNFPFLQRFGLIFFEKDENGKRIKGGRWGMPVKRVAQFLRNEGEISAYVIRDVDTGTNTQSEQKIKVSQVPRYNYAVDQETMFPVFIKYAELEGSGIF